MSEKKSHRPFGKIKFFLSERPVVAPSREPDTATRCLANGRRTGLSGCAVADAQKALFATGITRSYEWRVEQLDRMARMVKENEVRLQEAIARDFKTASAEYVFETTAELDEVEFQKSQLKSWMEPVEAPVPRFLRATGHKALVYREPYGVPLVMEPFNGPLLLMIRPALTALAAGNTCVLKLHPGLIATSPLPLELVPRYFDPAAVTAVPGDIPGCPAAGLGLVRPGRV
jgi:aldehyde dehydrogenase (NAD+)